MKTRRVTIATCLISAVLWSTVAWGDNRPLNATGKKHFEAGVAYVDDPSGPKWEEALKEFRLAYEESPTSRLMNNIGLCALNLERDGEAIEAFKAYLAGGAEPGLKSKQRKQIETDIATLNASLVKIRLTTVPDDATVIDRRENSKGDLITNLYEVKRGAAVIGMHPGRHRIRVEAAGYDAQEWVIDAQPASEHSHDFKLELEKKAEPTKAAFEPEAEQKPAAPPPKAEPHTPTGVYVGLALTGVFAAAATTTGIITLQKSKDLDKITDREAANSDQGTVKNWALVTDIGIGAAALSAVATAYFYFSAPKSEPEKQASSTRWQLAPVVTPTVAGGAVRGEF